MPKRLIVALAAALALLVAAPALAQDPTATAPAAQPPANASAGVKKIYSDYRDTGTVHACKHARDDLQDALDTIQDQFNVDHPHFRVALNAGIEDHNAGKCPQDARTPAATESLAPSATAAPTTESGTLPPSSTGGNGGGGATPPESGTIAPSETPTAGATVAPPAPTATAAPPVVTPGPSATPVIVTSSRTDDLLIPGILVGLALLGAAALALSAIFARRNPTVEAAWREAGMRVRGTWADFSDWLRLGR